MIDHVFSFNQKSREESWRDQHDTATNASNAEFFYWFALTFANPQANAMRCRQKGRDLIFYWGTSQDQIIQALTKRTHVSILDHSFLLIKEDQI